MKITVDTDDLKTLSVEAGKLYASEHAESALRTLWIELPRLLKEAQEEAENTLIEQVGDQVNTTLATDSLRVRIGRRKGLLKFEGDPIEEWRSKTPSNRVDTKLAKRV